MSDNKVLATVGEREITQKDVDLLLRSLDPQSAKRLDSVDGRKRVLQELINQELFYLDAIENGLENDASYLAEIEKLKASYLKQYSIGKLLGSISVDEKEIENYYEANKSTFAEGASVKASHILVDSQEKAQEIKKEIADGLSFEAAAQKYSSCPSKSNGGDLGFFTSGRMVPEFEEAAFEAQVNDITDPIKTQFGFHLIKVTDKKPAAEKSLAEVRAQIDQQLLANKQEAVFFSKVNELTGKYQVKISE